MKTIIKISLTILLIILFWADFLYYDNSCRKDITYCASFGIFILLLSLLILLWSFNNFIQNRTYRYIFLTILISLITINMIKIFYSYEDFIGPVIWIILISINAFFIGKYKNFGNKKKLILTIIWGLGFLMLSLIPFIQVLFTYHILYTKIISNTIFFIHRDFEFLPRNIWGYLILFLNSILLSYTLTWFFIKNQEEIKKEL